MTIGLMRFAIGKARDLVLCCRWCWNISARAGKTDALRLQIRSRKTP
jgi:hypothetical protein